ncbi:hypothetical protein [Micromonospora sp. NPDC049274]|uniref:hypothetical protein n=1 Tax=Micromonospora sp. NPDC049274 TaxID=3154829 RepID=UPI003417BE0A
MREDDLAFVERVHRDLRDVTWPEPGEIRAMARRRRRRTATFAAIAVLAAMTGPAYAMKDRPEPPPTAATRVPVDASPARADIPLDSLLRATDVPVKSGVQLGDAGLGEVMPLDPLLRRCGGERGLPVVDSYSRYSRSLTLLSPADAGRTSVTAVLSQDVYRVDPAVGRQFVGQLRMVLDACREWRDLDTTVASRESVPLETVHSWAVPATNFAGDESMVVRHESSTTPGSGDGRASGSAVPAEMSVVVRVGDLVTVLVPGPGVARDRADGTGSSLGYGDLEALGRAAARRLCPAAHSPC